MKIQIDGRVILEVDDKMKQVLAHDIGANVDGDIERRLKWVINHKYTNVKQRIIQQWFPTLQERYDTLPSKDDQLLDLIFQQSDYTYDKNFYLDNQSDDDRQSR